MNKNVILRPLFHREMECIGIYFDAYSVLSGALKKTKVVFYSNTHKCWYTPLSRENYNLVYRALKDLASIEKNALYEYLAHKKKKTGLLKLPGDKMAAATFPGINRNKYPAETSQAGFYKDARIHAINKHVLSSMKQQLQLKAYSPSTIKTYMAEMAALLHILKNIPADLLQPEHLKRYLVYCYETLRLTENTLHSRINAMKFYYEQVLKKEKFFWEIPRPKKPALLPKLLNEDELTRLFNALKNKKHKAMLFTAYSAGLRVSEVVNLKLSDIDSQRMQILIRRAKGKKDRYVNLSPVLLDILRNYIREFRPRPTEYLFESEQTGTAYPTRTAQQIFSNARKKARISKEVGIHSLRHSFATHLLDKGTDIHYIKNLLGHFNIKTTERYLHVSKKQLVNIISPFDDLWRKNALEW